LRRLVSTLALELRQLWMPPPKLRSAPLIAATHIRVPDTFDVRGDAWLDFLCPFDGLFLRRFYGAGPFCTRATHCIVALIASFNVDSFVWHIRDSIPHIVRSKVNCAIAGQATTASLNRPQRRQCICATPIRHGENVMPIPSLPWRFSHPSQQFVPRAFQRYTQPSHHVDAGLLLARL
jgi:hypothetical protein